MPSCCSVPGCRSNYKAEIEVVKVFQFPSDEERRALWLRTIPRTDWVPGKRSVVCIKHFNPEDVVKEDSVQRSDGSYLVVPRTNLKLKPDAVPCIFEPEEQLIVPGDSKDGFLEQGAKENQNTEEFHCCPKDIISISEMPFFWKPENKRTQISPERMKSAVLQVVVEGKSIRSAAKEHRIDRKTLGRYVQKFRTTKDDEIDLKPNYSSAQIFTDPEEKQLEEYLTLAAEIHSGLTSKVARQIAYEHGVALKKILPDNWYATKCASYDWLRGFLHRHRSFSLRNPHAVGSRASEFSENYKSKNKYIAAVFESGIANVHNSKFTAGVNESDISGIYDPVSIAGVHESAVSSVRDSKFIAGVHESAVSSVRDSKFIADVDESGISSVHDSKFIANVDKSGVSNVRRSKKVFTEKGKNVVPSELQATHDPECLLNTTGSSNFTPFCTCQYKSENHISITPISNVPKPEEIYILPTTDEPNDEDLVPPVHEGTEYLPEVRSTRRNYKRKLEKSPESSDYPIIEEVEKEHESKESKRTRRKRKLQS